MEAELEPRVKPLPYKVKAISRESLAQKAANLLDTDLRNHWSTATNTKEWILLELEEPALLSHIRIYNKSVLEWEISAGLRYKPETFVKVRPRSEAPRRDMTYPMNYTPCRYVRISCMRGTPIAIFFIQLIGIPVSGLEPEFQPVANYLLPYIISQKGDMHLQLLQDVTSRLARFLPHLEVDLNGLSEAAEPTVRFLAMLAGPYYPLLQVVSERETARLAVIGSEHETSKSNPLSTVLTVSSNFEPRRSRNTPSLFSPISHVVFRPDAVFMLLRKAYKDPKLGDVCRTVSRILFRLMEPMKSEAHTKASDITSSGDDGAPKFDACHHTFLNDYSDLFGKEFQIHNDYPDPPCLNLLDNAAVEEGLMHVLYASASEPLHCRRLAENTSDIWLSLPLIQALLPALRPTVNSPYQIDDKFSLWKQPFVQNAMSQIVVTSSSTVYRPLLHACAGYLSSFSPSHAKAACVLIDLCSGVLAPWIGQVIAKVDLAVELLEDLLGVIQGARYSLPRARAALKYIVLALSGNMDDIMAKYKDAKHRILFLVEMLEPFLDPAVNPTKDIVFGSESSIFIENQERNCAIAVNVIRTAIKKAAVLPSLETEWRRGSVSPSVLLSVLDAQLQLPHDIDSRKSSSVEVDKAAPSSHNRPYSSKSNEQEHADVKVDDIDTNGKTDAPEDAGLLFAPQELNRMSLTLVPATAKFSDASHLNNLELNNVDQKKLSNQFQNNLGSDMGQDTELYNLLVDYSQLMNYRDCELKASEFRRLALDLHSQGEISPESQGVAIDALLLAAECYIVPRAMMSMKDISPDLGKFLAMRSSENHGLADINRIFRPIDKDLKLVADIERKRDRAVIELLIEAAVLDRKYQKVDLEDEIAGSDVEGDEEVIKLSQEDTLSADAVTLVRQNQSLLCRFLIRRSHKDSVGEQHSTREILMWCLLFLLHSATKLSCSPEQVVDLILNFAESLNMELKDGNKQLSSSGLPELQRGLSLLRRLVIASSGSNGRSEVSINVRSGVQLSNLIPSLVWLLKVPAFSSSAYPLVRYFGWMAMARNAKQYIKERLFLVSDLSQLIHLLSIFSDDLSLVDNMIEQKNVNKSFEEIGGHSNIKFEDGAKSYHQNALQSFNVLYPDISRLFPTLKKEFEAFGETILEAVGLQLKFLSSTAVPDLISWFASLCSCPFVKSEKGQLFLHKPDYFKGFVAKNAKAVILYMLEVIVVEHMEAMVPEIPRVVQVLVSLCRSSYCDVAFLDSVLRLLKPIIVYSLTKVPDEEKLLINESCENFESLCFGELFNYIRCPDENQVTASERGRCPALTIFVLATMFGDLSFRYKTGLLQSSILWAEFSSFEETTVFPDYLCAYQVLMENCKELLIGSLRVWGIIPLEASLHSDAIIGTVDDSSKSFTWLLNDICRPSPTEVPEKHLDDITAVSDVDKNACQLTLEEIKSVCSNLEDLISKLNPTLEKCWIIHHTLAKKLAVTTADCFIYSRCLSLCADKVSVSSKAEKYNPSELVDEFPDVWRSSLEGFVKMILLLQENHCWEVAFVLLDSILRLPLSIFSDKVVADVCSAMKNFSNFAPNMCWRLQTDKLLSLLLARKLEDNGRAEVPFIDLFSEMLGHSEPEQRYIALKHLGRLVGLDVDGRTFLSSTTEITAETSDLLHSTPERFLSLLVSATWDQVALVASSDTSLLLRTHATSLLISYIPFAKRDTLQSFLAAADSVVQCLTTLALPTSYGPLTQFSLALIASVCLYSPAEDISLIPEHIWSNIETIAISRNGRYYCTGFEKSACEALFRLRKNDGQAKQILKEVLSLSSPKEQIPDLMTTRESILQVIGNLTSARSYFDFFAKEVDQKTMELEEAEMEMELLKREHQAFDSSLEHQDWHQLPFLSTYNKDERRLMQIKDEIRSVEKAKLREEIAARRQQKLLLRRARQQFLEDAALREAELLQKLDRDKTSEVEKELERQQLLELERAKTRELRHNLDLEKERQAQRDLQRELEQVESGIRPSRREFQSSSQSRTRDRYRERDNEREGNEGNMRTSSRNVQRDTVTTSSSPANASQVVLAGNRSFSGQLPTILQSRERSEDTGSVEENLSRGDSGDTGSVGDPDIVSALEGQSVGFGSGQRHGSRGGKSRQIVDRRERDSGSRREGKWERKH